MSDHQQEEQPADETAEEPERYAVVEIFGHRKHVGRIMEVERFGSKMLRVDVPNDGDFAAGFVSHFYSGGAIFGLTETDLDTVRRANRPWQPTGHYSLPAPEDDGCGDEDLLP